VYSAILRLGGVSWLRQIARDTGMDQRTVKRHLGHLTRMDLVERRSLGMYWITGREATPAVQEGRGEPERTERAEALKEWHFEVVKTLLDDSPELRNRVKAYLDA